MTEFLKIWGARFLFLYVIYVLGIALIVGIGLTVVVPSLVWVFSGHWQWMEAETSIRYVLSSLTQGLLVAVPLTCHHWYQLGRESKVVKWLVIVVLHVATLALVFGVLNPAIKKLAKALLSL